MSPRPAALWRASSLAALVVAAGVFWGSANSTAAARTAGLWNVEPLAMAVHEQLLYNRTFHGTWEQSLHRGYDDSWAWSGHRSGTFLLVRLLYALDPSPNWLAGLQILGVLLGVVPSALLGRAALRHEAGLALGGLLYLAAPVTLALALQDYQDLVFALPALLWARYAFGVAGWGWRGVAVALSGAVVGLLPREESALLTVLVAATAGGYGVLRWRHRLALQARNTVVAAALVVGTILLLDAVDPVARTSGSQGGYDVPLLHASFDFFRGLVAFAWPGFQRPWFYALLLAPAGPLALLAPLTLVPGLVVVVFHASIPAGMGIDRSWLAHAHHLAPAWALILAAQIEGLGTALRWLFADRAQLTQPMRRFIRRWGVPTETHRRRIGVGLLVVVAAAQGAGLGWFCWWAGVIPSLAPRTPRDFHPAWTLAERIPADAVPVVFDDAALTVSRRRVAFSLLDSLSEESGGRGLGAASHALVDLRDGEVVAWVEAMPGAHRVATEELFALYTWDRGAPDPRAANPPRPAPASPWRPRDAERPPGMPRHEATEPDPATTGTASPAP